MSSLNKADVRRVLVMLDYGDDDPRNGEVFDVTALTMEIGNKSEHQQAQIQLKVDVTANYRGGQVNGKYPLKTQVLWRLMANYNLSPESATLDDAINSGMPDSIATQELKKDLKIITDKAAKINADILEQKLRDAAAVRSKHPIARVTAPGLAQVAEPEQLPAPNPEMAVDPTCPTCGGGHPVGCCAQDGHGG